MLKLERKEKTYNERSSNGAGTNSERIQALQKDINVKQICDEIGSCDIVSTSTDTSTCDNIVPSVLHIE